MEWCCHSAKARFDARNQYGEFLVAGRVPDVGEVWFFSGFNMTHRQDYSDVIGAIKAATATLKEIGISNFKLDEHHCVHFCAFCGTKLIDFYGSEGGALRDDEYVMRMRANI